MSSAHADRNLLFGILALQMNFITRDALLKGMNAWVLEKHRPLGQILVEQGALRPDLHDMLEAMVRKHLEVHDNDAQKSLAAISSVGSLAKDLEQIADPDVYASVGHVQAARPGQDDSWGTHAPTQPVSTRGVRYKRLRPHDKGGLGVVFVALDEELQREVALKELQVERADDQANRARFLLEAEVTGKLEHPGIVPIYGLGSYDDGRPFYAMRFVKGDSLKDAIDRFHRQAPPDPGRRAVELRELLGRFLDVCDAVAYAHSRGVLHRDLKPGNVMLGRYGETLVVDWGLAKVLGDQDDQSWSADGPVTTSGNESTRTLQGRFKGTPQYASPEQAAGRLDLLGPASDVYSLGATLYCLLTGKAPFPPCAAEDLGPLLRKVAQGSFPPPRQVQPDVPLPLEAICLKAMSLRREDRYATPAALAQDVRQWLAGEPVTAWPEPLAVKAGRWVRKHQALAASTAAALVVALVLGSAGGVWWRQKQEQERLALLARQDRAAERAEATLARATDLRKRMRWKEARLLLSQAGDAAREADTEALVGRLEQARVDLDLAEELHRVREEAYDLVEGRWDPYRVKEKYPAIFRKFGFDVLEGPVDALASRLQNSGVREEVLAALDDWTNSERTAKERRLRLLELSARVDSTNRWRRELLEKGVPDDPRRLRALSKRVTEESLSPATAIFLATLSGRGSPEARELLTRARERNPDDFWLNVTLATSLEVPQEKYVEERDRSRQEEAIGYFRAALAVKRDSSVTWNNLGIALGVKKDVESAIRSYREAIRLDPKYAKAHYNLGNALRARNDVEGAIKSYREAIRLDPGNSQAHNNLGVALAARNDVEGAIKSCREATRLDPKNAQAHNNLGNALRARGDVEGAIQSCREAIRLDPGLAQSHYNLGAALRARKDMKGAIKSYREAIRLDPGNARAHYNLGIALGARNDVEGAIRSYREAIRLNPKYARAHSNLGAALHARGDVEGAIKSCREAIRLDPGLARAHHNLGIALRARGDVEGAIKSYREAIRLDPGLAQSHYNLGNALRARNDVEGAIKSYREAIRLNPRYAEAHNNLGATLHRKGDVEGAIQSCREAIRLDPGLAQAHNNLGNALRARGDVGGAVRSCREAVRLDPGDAQAHGALGLALMTYGDFANALISSRRAFELLPPAHPQSRVAVDQLAACKRLLRLEKTLQAVLAGQRAPRDPKERIALADIARRPAKGFYANAVRLYRDAFQTQPSLAAIHRYNAACCAAVAGTGKGKDAGKLDNDRAHLRYAALSWLQEDLSSHAQKVKGRLRGTANQSRKTLLHWQKGADLAAVRDPGLLRKLPEAEQVAWGNLWAQVDALLAHPGAGR
jgi:tetratricopeptide (TPR) repeat protein/tRNA A-37 threonylcarbamoyl transferase component Bud32